MKVEVPPAGSVRWAGISFLSSRSELEGHSGMAASTPSHAYLDSCLLFQPIVASGWVSAAAAAGHRSLSGRSGGEERALVGRWGKGEKKGKGQRGIFKRSAQKRPLLSSWRLQTHAYALAWGHNIFFPLYSTFIWLYFYIHLIKCNLPFLQYTDALIKNVPKCWINKGILFYFVDILIWKQMFKKIKKWRVYCRWLIISLNQRCLLIVHFVLPLQP